MDKAAGVDKVESGRIGEARKAEKRARETREARETKETGYREVLGVDMPWLRELGRPVAKKRIPVVLTHVEVQALLARMGEGVTGLLGRLLYVPAPSSSPRPRARSPRASPPSSRPTPSFTAAATSAS